MADNSDMRFQAGQVAGQAQMKKDNLMDRASETAQNAKEQAGGFMQEKGEQMKNMAHGAADTVKNAVGMGDAHATSTTKKL